MGYQGNSPVKQIWLPLDYDWINNVVVSNGTFGKFAKAYKDKYGIDLHDIFGLNRDGNSYGVALKVDLVGSYNVGKLDDLADTKYAVTNALSGYQYEEQGAEKIVLLKVFVGDLNRIGHGFSITLPSRGTTVNSIDDLGIEMYDI